MFRKTLIARCLTLLVLALLSTNLAWGEDTWVKLTSAPQAGDVVILVNETAKREMTGISTTSTKYGLATTYETSPAGSYPLTVCAGNSDGSLAFKTSDNKYLYWTSGNSLNVNATLDNKTSWTVTVSNGDFTITNVATNTRVIKYNSVSGQERFACYTSEQEAIQLYKKGSGDEPVAPAITTQPEGASYEKDATATALTIAASGNPTPTYQWYSNTTESTSGASLISGATNASYTPSTATIGTKYYYCVATNTEGSATSDIVAITVTAALPKITITADKIANFTNSYQEYTWTANDVSGKCRAYRGGSSGSYNIQFNQTTYVYNTTAVPGRITSVKMTKVAGTTRSWSIYGANEALTRSNYTTAGTQIGSAQEVSSESGTTWNVPSDQNYTYFYITKADGGTNIGEIVITYEAAPIQTITSIAVQTPPSKTTYFVGETFNPAGLVITATYDEGDPEDIAYAGNESKFTFNPTLETALTKDYNNVNITYGGKSVDQAITVNLIQLATPTNLNATTTSTSATLTWDAVANASSYEVNVLGDDYDETFTPTANSLLVEGLTASTAYIWTVKAIGNGTTYGNSDESAASEFTTSALPTVAYTVTFNGNEHGTPASESLTENPAGSGVTLPNCTPNAGYQFVGWATLETATEAEYGAGAIYHPTANITLYAVYNEVYTINYMVNGTNTGAQENVVKGTALVFPEVSAPDADHVFCGWVTTAIEGTQPTAPEYVNTEGLTATQNITYYAVFAEQGGSEPAEEKTQTLLYDTWTYYGSTTNKSSYRLFHKDSYIESTEFDLSKLTKVIVYGGTFGGDSYNSLTIGDGTNTWKSVTVYGSSQTGTNTYTDGTPLSGTGKLRVTSNSGTASGTGVRISKVEIFTMEGGYTYSNYCTTIVEKVLTGISLSGEYPTEFWKGETFSHEGMTVTAHYSNAPDADVTDKAEFTGYDMATAGEQTVTVSYEPASTTYDITVKTIANTKETAYTTAEAIALIDDGNDLGTEVYVKGTVSKVDSYNSQYKSITYWLDNNAFEVYSGKNLNNTDFTSKDDVKVGDDVIIYGKIKKWNSTYEFDSGNYLVSHVKAATLSINDITVSLGEEISPKITTNVTGEYTITYFVPSEGEGVVKVDEDGNLVIVAVGGPVTVTAKLTAAGYKDAETTFTVEVIKVLTSIKIATPPTTLEYKAGDKFDPTGLVITANYNDESTEDVAYAENENKFTFTPSLETPLTTDNTSVTITYAGKETTQDISVRALYTYNITWMANGEEHTTTQVTEGDAVVVPENPSAVGDMAFQGWINTESYYNAETAPEYIVPSGIIPTGAMTFYAVYAKATSEFQEKDVTYTFTSKSWGDATSSWTSGKDGSEYTTNQGVQVTTGVTGANATSKSAFTEVTKVVVNYCTNSKAGKGTIKVKVGDGTAQSYSVSAPSSGGTTLRDTDDMIFENETGNVNITVECTTNSIYINSITITSKVGEETISNFCTTVTSITENTTISKNTVWDGNITINGNVVTIENGAVLTINGALINTDPEKLIIEDGGQLIFNNSGVQATVEKNIIPYGRGGKGWHFLAAPMEDFTVESFIYQANGKYDLYRWYIKDDGTPIWYNYKAHYTETYSETDGTGFEPKFVSGRGYLAAYEKKDLLKMQGTLNAGTTFDFTGELNSKGNFTLLGNPFTYELKWSDFNKTGVYDKGFAVVDSEYGIIKYVAGTTPIKVGTGFMVYTEDDNAGLSFTRGNESGKSNDILALNLFASNGNGEDNTIIVIDDNNGGFAKASNFNTNVPQIYTERLQTKYGIRNFSTNTKEFFVSFKAVGEGSNTIRLETIGEFDYVHLYDKLLDIDVDMLLEGSYTFEASEGDDTHRFIVRIDKGNTGIDENETENFVNVYNGEIHVSGSGEVQIFDVMGRMVHSEVISGDATISTGGFKGGVYVVRLIGNGWTKTEKIVVRR